MYASIKPPVFDNAKTNENKREGESRKGFSCTYIKRGEDGYIKNKLSLCTLAFTKIFFIEF